LLQLAREGLLSHLRAAIERAKQQNLPARAEKVRVKGNGHNKEFNLEILPMAAPASGKRHYIILFEDTDLFVGAAPPEKRRAAPVAEPDGPDGDKERANV